MEDPGLILGLTCLFLLMAVLYSAVGQGGGSGYLAAMALLGVAPESFRIIALTLNVVVASIGLVKFTRAGHFNGRLLLPFIVTSVPLAFVGGYFSLPAQVFRPLVGLALLWAAALLIWKPPTPEEKVAGEPPLWASLSAGGGIGLLSGLIGIGGGIFLAPFLILKGWASAKTTACLSSAFILVNSLAALVGVAFHAQEVPVFLPVWMGAVALGGWLGAGYGANRLSPRTLHWLLAVVLLVAGARIVLAG
ncbi:MAG: sulfite exporter TauE/SafE family protein [Gemmatimonadales bacterium]|nr:MAG: sulfite exporter TauE/SafE family protein [Gemmatimonadales bacterium]